MLEEKSRLFICASLLTLLLAPSTASAWTGETEPNNDQSAAMTIESGQAIRGNIAQAVSSSNPDYDWFKLDIDPSEGLSGIMIRIESDDCQSCKSIHYAIYNQSGTLLYSENSEQTVSSFSKGIVQTEHNVTGPTYIKVFANKLVNEYFLTAYVRAGDPYVGEDEGAGNNSRSAAGSSNTLPNAKLWRGNISTNSDEDWYRLGGQAGDYSLWVESEGCDRDGDGERPGCSTLSWGVYDQNGTRLYSFLSDANTSTQAVFSPFTLNTNANFYLKVESDHTFSSLDGKNWSNRSYKLRIFYPTGASGNTGEGANPNENKSQARLLTSSVELGGNISSASSNSTWGDRDFYKISNGGGDTLSGLTFKIQADDYVGSKSFHYQLYQWSNDQLIAAENAEQNATPDDTVQLTLADYNIKGDAYLIVEKANSGDDYDIVAYTFPGEPYGAEVEPNNSPNDNKTLNRLELAKDVHGNISTTGDVDYWHFTTTEDGDAHFMIEAEGCDADGSGELPGCTTLEWALYSPKNPNYQIYYSYSEPGTIKQVKMFSVRDIEAGDYYLKVFSNHKFSGLGGTNWSNRTYRITAAYPYTPPSFTVTASAGTGGSISPTQQLVQLGNTATFTITPAAGYAIYSVEGSCGGTLVGNTFTTNPVTQHCTVTATFEQTSVEIGIQTPTNGTVSPSGFIPVVYGNYLDLTVTPSAGFKSADPLGDCSWSWQGLNTLKVGPVTASCSIAPQFEQDLSQYYSVSLEIEGGISSVSITDVGSLDSSGILRVLKGDGFKFYAFPESSYEVSIARDTCGLQAHTGPDFTDHWDAPERSADCSITVIGVRNYALDSDGDGVPDLSDPSPTLASVVAPPVVVKSSLSHSSDHCDQYHPTQPSYVGQDWRTTGIFESYVAYKDGSGGGYSLPTEALMYLRSDFGYPNFTEQRQPWDSLAKTYEPSDFPADHWTGNHQLEEPLSDTITFDFFDQRDSWLWRTEVWRFESDGKCNFSWYRVSAETFLKPIDSDGDSVADANDNCKFAPNTNQTNTDGDAEGDACDADDDNDGLPDTAEVAIGTNPLKADTDGDRLSDKEEVDLGTSPIKKDTDGDGWSDYDEVTEGTDPKAANSQPEPNSGLPIWLLYQATQ